MDNPGIQEPNDEVSESAVAETEAPAEEIEAQENQEEQQPDLAEIEYDGEKFQLPAKLKDAFMRQQDYSRKTAEVAEQRRATEADREAIQAEREAAAEERKLNQSMLRLAAQREHLTASYQQLDQINLIALNQQDPVQAQQVLIQKQQIANALNQVHGQLTQEQQKAAEAEQQSNAKLAEKAAAHLAKEISGWQPNNEVDRAITEYAEKNGLKGQSFARAVVQHPQIGVLLHKAQQLDAIMAKQAKPAPAPQAKPVTRITASSGQANKDPSKMTDAEFAAWRKRQIAQRR